VSWTTSSSERSKRKCIPLQPTHPAALESALAASRSELEDRLLCWSMESLAFALRAFLHTCTTRTTLFFVHSWWNNQITGDGNLRVSLTDVSTDKKLLCTSYEIAKITYKNLWNMLVSIEFYCIESYCEVPSNKNKRKGILLNCMPFSRPFSTQFSSPETEYLKSISHKDRRTPPSRCQSIVRSPCCTGTPK
jgi:hypothetical protein